MRRACFVAIIAGTLIACVPPSATAASVASDVTRITVAASPSSGLTATDSLAGRFVQRISICGPQGCVDPPQPICAGDSITVVVEGAFPNTCFRQTGFDLYVPPYASARMPLPWVRILYEDHTCQGLCGMVLMPLRARIKLPPMRAGSYGLTVAMQPAGCDTVLRTLEPVTFTVVDSCDTLPPPPNALPYVDRVTICANQPSRGDCGPICPTDSIAVLISGNFPPCYALKRVDVLPPPPSFREAAPHLRLVVDNGCCAAQRCVPGPNPWHTVVMLPPMSAGPYHLPVMVAEVCCGDSVPPGELPTALFPFAVSDRCAAPPTDACLWGGWMHADNNECDAFLAPGTPATVTFGINSSVPLAGLQGEFQLSLPVYTSLDAPRPGPFISRIVPVRAAAGMRLSWTATPNGARFVLFADDGRLIPASPPFEGPRVPVLAVTVEVPAGTTVSSDIAVSAGNLLGSDARGGAVPKCAIRADERCAGQRCVEDPARICTSLGCDFNGDGIANVRDLVTMVRCLRSDTCANATRFDCDRDGGFDLDDVLCCAWHVLRRPPCNGCAPDTTPPRKEDGVKLVMDAPVIAGDDVGAGLAIVGADRVGGARLELRFPTDRYEFVSLDGIGADWLALTEVRDGALVVGLVRIAETEVGLASQSLSVHGTLRLRLRPGMSPGGELVAAAAEFSGTDGARIEVGSSGTSQPLAEGMAFALSDNRPDPFSGTTRFTLTLPEAAEADLGVFDVGGRRVATVHRGRLTAGVSEFAWDGGTGRGGRVASGVYFYRATVAGRTVSKKMVVLND